MQVLLAGDWHANTAHATAVLALAAELGIDRVVQVGDFGFWPRYEEGVAYLEAVSEATRRHGVEVWFCDGNHEDHDELPHDTSLEPVELFPGIRWVPRGTVLEWAGRRILFMGGAVSVDRDFREAGRSWFASEIPTAAQWARAGEAGRVDLVVAHDTVPGMPVKGTRPTLSIPWSARRRASDHRKRLRSLRDAVEPAVWVHGHWHQRATARLDGTRFESLAHDRVGLRGSVLVCDLGDLSLHDPVPAEPSAPTGDPDDRV
jgi:predicted phosphodiesterase